MNTYKVIMFTATSGVPFELTFTLSSDVMAQQYACAVAKQCAQISWFMGFTLFKAANPTLEDWNPIGVVTVKTETIPHFTTDLRQ